MTERTLSDLLDAYLYPYIEVSRDKHTASAAAYIIFRDGSTMTWADWKEHVRSAATGAEVGT